MRRSGASTLGKRAERSLQHMDKLEQQTDDILKTHVLVMVDLSETTVTGAATLDEIIEKNPGITNVEIMQKPFFLPEIHIEPVDRTIQVNKRE